MIFLKCKTQFSKTGGMVRKLNGIQRLLRKLGKGGKSPFRTPWTFQRLLRKLDNGTTVPLPVPPLLSADNEAVNPSLRNREAVPVPQPCVLTKGAHGGFGQVPDLLSGILALARPPYLAPLYRESVSFRCLLRKLGKGTWLPVISLVLILTLGVGVAQAEAKLNVVTTSTDLKSIAQEIGGDKIEVTSLARGGDDLHFLSARPSFILKVNRADLLVLVGLDLEAGWLPLILKKSRNPKVRIGTKGYCDASVGVGVLDKPQGVIDRASGDVHVHGNPHYWTDPVYGVIIARNILASLKKIDSGNQKIYQKNFNLFKQKMKVLLASFRKKMSPHKNKKIFVFHKEFSYVAKRFGLQIAGSIEEKPGVPPGPAHIKRMIQLAKSEGVKIILNTPWQNLGYSQTVARESNAKLLILPAQTGSAKGTETYFKMLEKVMDLLGKSL